MAAVHHAVLSRVDLLTQRSMGKPVASGGGGEFRPVLGPNRMDQWPLERSEERKSYTALTDFGGSWDPDRLLAEGGYSTERANGFHTRSRDSALRFRHARPLLLGDPDRDTR